MLKIATLVFGTAALGATLFAGRQLSHPHDGRFELASDNSVTTEGATTLKIQAPIASLTLETSNTGRLSVHGVRWTKDPSSEAGKKWMSGVTKVSHDHDLLVVEDTVDGDHSMKNLKGNFNGGLDLHITAPRGLKVKLELGVGNALTSGNYNSVNLSVGAGQMTGKFDLSGGTPSSVNVGAGEVKLDLPSGTNLDLTTATGVGEISGIPGSSKKTEGIHLGDRRSVKVGAGGTSLSVHVGAGSITINSASSVTAMTTADRFSDTEKGSREEHLWSGDVDASISSDPIKGDSLDELGPQIEAALAQVQPEIDRAMKETQPQIDKAMAQVGPEVDRALREAQPEIDKALADIGPEIQRALKDAKPEMDRDLANVGPEIERAMKEARQEMAKAQKERRRALQEAGPEIDRAMKEAERSLDEAARELDREGIKHDHFDQSIRKSVQEALRSARAAVRESMKAARKAIDEAKKTRDDREDD